jgi:hypothetical protein
MSEKKFEDRRQENDQHQNSTIPPKVEQFLERHRDKTLSFPLKISYLFGLQFRRQYPTAIRLKNVVHIRNAKFIGVPD